MALSLSSAAGNASYIATTTTTGTYNGPPPSLITQFVQPTSCTSLFAVFSTQLASDSVHRTTTTIFTSDASNLSFSPCQPAGWDQASFSFSPAVCPSSWTYFSMSTTISGKVPVSVAACCARFVQSFDAPYSKYRLILNNSNYILETDYSNYNHGYACVSNTRNFPYTTETAQLHSPWHVAWQPSDTAKFPFSLPAIPTSSFIQSWAPNQTPAQDNNRQGGDGLGSLGPTVMALGLGIGLPILCIILGITFYCIVRKRRRKRALQHNQSGSEMTVVGTSTANTSA